MIGHEAELDTWTNDELAAEVVRLRSIVGWDEVTFMEQRLALLAAREHTIGLLAELGELRALTADLRPDRPMVEVHMRNLEKRLERTTEWAQELAEHAERVEEWAKGVEAHSQAVQSWADQLAAQVFPESGYDGEALAKAQAYDRIMRLPGARLARRVIRTSRKFLRGSSR